MTRPAIVSVNDPALPYSILQGDCLETLKTLPDGCVQMACTSPPYYSLRDYQTASWEGGDPECQHSTGNQVNITKDAGTNRDGVYSSGVRPGSDNTYCRKCGACRIDSQIGLEESPKAYVAKLVEVFREVRRVLRDDGTLWLNLGDSYAGSGGYYPDSPSNQAGTLQSAGNRNGNRNKVGATPKIEGIKPKDLFGIPWMVAFALRADGWYLRSDIIWHKPNPMPESVTDRPTKAHEYIFLLSKSREYYYDADAVKEAAVYGENRATYIGGTERLREANIAKGGLIPSDKGMTRIKTETRNRRSVWTVATAPYSGAHFATYPPDLIEPCILAGSKPDDTVLDPFNGAATTGLVALKHGRKYIGCELNEDYITLSHKRLLGVASQQRLFEVA